MIELTRSHHAVVGAAHQPSAGRRAGLCSLGLIMGLAVAADLVTVQANGFEKPAFIVAMALLGADLLLRLKSGLNRLVGWRLLTLTATLGISGFIGVPFREGGTAFYTAGDLGVVVAPAMIALSMSSWKDAARSFFVPFFAVLLLASLLAGVLAVDGSRFEAPPLILVAAIGAAAAIARKRKSRVLAFAILIGLALLALMSGERASLLLSLAVLAFTLGVWFRLTASKLILITPVVMLFIVSLLDSGVLSSLASRALSIEAVSSSRIVALGVGNKADDASTTARLLEAQDVIDEMIEQASPLIWMFGNGHGATYQPRLSFIDRNVGEDNRVHHIHVGPAMVLYRYGLVGLALYAVLLVSSVVYAWRAYHFFLYARVRGHAPDGLGAFQALCSLALLLYVINSFTHNSFASLPFAVALAGALSLDRGRPKPRAIVGFRVNRPIVPGALPLERTER
ncbi:hypothetical protein [Sinimarinibacterium thermocellulolyticum]|uniref:O-antigen ligase n=1 Tax=Sinimarinibacterium thermocellulolyticum TaxID=3170016 RepID=A0ABV2A5L6_9GAMM